MAVSQADLDALDAAILNSELEVEFDGRRVRYRSIDELQRAYGHAKSVFADQQRRTAQAGGSFTFTFTTQRGD